MTSARRAVLCVALGAALIGVSTHASADNAWPITRVEEDWQITFGTPDPDLNAPQITMTMSPWTSLDGRHAVFEINSQTEPSYAAGGMQLQHWFGNTCLDYKSSQKQGVLNVANDVMTFTMYVAVQNSTITFGVTNGNSQTWGTFGSGESLLVSDSYDGTDLNLYDPNGSLANSYVGFGANRIQQAVRTAIRYYSNNTLIGTDTTQRVLWQYTGP